MKKIFISVFLLLFILPNLLGSAQPTTTPIFQWKLVLPEGNKTDLLFASYNKQQQYEESKKQLTCLARNIYFEARNEPFAGQFAVALVTLNRVHDSAFPNTLCGVVYESKLNSNGFPRLHRCQFSWYCDGIPDTIKNESAYEKTTKIAELAVNSYVTMKEGGLDYTEGARFYHTFEVNPKWSKVYPKIGRIGDHIFYR